MTEPYWQPMLVEAMNEVLWDEAVLGITVCIALLGVRGILMEPGVLAALNPWHAVQFFVRDGLGVAVLVFTRGLSSRMHRHRLKHSQTHGRDNGAIAA